MFTNKQRRTALAVCIGIVAIVLLSMAFVAVESDHQCTGPDCPVCASLQAVAEGMNQLGLGLIMVSAVAAPISVMSCYRIRTAQGSSCGTPVDRKVRMND
ncbi:MAG: hypothetical protein K5767_01975 [Clostridia bacterium]|nr:hypothetical protein [Clostridia bacterium]